MIVYFNFANIIAYIIGIHYYKISEGQSENNMVKLGFTLHTKGPIEKVFAYFSRFERISEWDLNVQSSKILK